MLELNNKVILITGGASGLGLHCANYLSNQGATIVVIDCDEKNLSEISNQFDTYKADVTNPHQVSEVIANITEKHQKIDVLINNAGIIYSEPMVNIMNQEKMMHSYQSFQNVLKINLDSVFIVSSAVIQSMVTARTKGCIINISSICATGNEGQTAYSASKAAVNAMTVSWSKELGRLGIRCNAIAPGFINTASTQNSITTSQIEHIVNATAIRRLGEPEDISKAVTSLIENDFINGTILDVNGGLVI